MSRALRKAITLRGYLGASWGPNCAALSCLSSQVTARSYNSSGQHSNASASSRSAWSRAALATSAAVTSMLCVTTASCSLSDSFDNVKKRQFFKYEKRLRHQSTHEKMFVYFSSQKGPEGKHCMTAQDIVRALISIYPPEEATWSRSGSLDGERAPHFVSKLSPEAAQFLKDFDIDGDGTFSYEEFLIFLVLLSMPLKDMQALFAIMDADGSGTLDKSEFLDVMRGLVKLSGKASPSAISRTGLETSSGVGGMAGSAPGANEPFIDKWFGKDGTKRMHFETFQTFLVQLHHIFDDMEFDMLDCNGDGTISGLDLARSFVAPAEVQRIDDLLDRAEAMPKRLREARIDRKTFLAAQQVVRKFHRFSFPLFFWQDTGHSTDGPSMRRLARQVCKTDVPEVVIDIFFEVFKDAGGRWDSEGMTTAMFDKYQHVKFSKGDHRPGLLQCMLDCVAPVQP